MWHQSYSNNLTNLYQPKHSSWEPQSWMPRKGCIAKSSPAPSRCLDHQKWSVAQWNIGVFKGESLPVTHWKWGRGVWCHPLPPFTNIFVYNFYHIMRYISAHIYLESHLQKNPWVRLWSTFPLLILLGEFMRSWSMEVHGSVTVRGDVSQNYQDP